MVNNDPYSMARYFLHANFGTVNAETAVELDKAIQQTIDTFIRNLKQQELEKAQKDG
jgi:hypothetical protein